MQMHSELQIDGLNASIALCVPLQLSQLPTLIILKAEVAVVQARPFLYWHWHPWYVLRLFIAHFSFSIISLLFLYHFSTISLLFLYNFSTISPLFLYYFSSISLLFLFDFFTIFLLFLHWYWHLWYVMCLFITHSCFAEALSTFSPQGHIQGTGEITL